MNDFQERLGARQHGVLTEYAHRKIRSSGAREFEHYCDAHIAHAKTLSRAGVISKESEAAIIQGVRDLLEDGFSSLPIADDQIDLFTNIELALNERITKAIAGELHTGRSRNDLYMAIARLTLREAIKETIDKAENLRSVILRQSRRYYDAKFPGYTHHSQQAQPVTFGHFLLAHYDRLGRDVKRLRDAYAETNISPLGAAALAGTVYPLDRGYTADLLGFDGIVENSEDAVSARDFQVLTISAGAMLAQSLSSLADSLILYSSTEFGYVDLPDSMSGVSSIMPQKKNPVGPELSKFAVSRLSGCFTAAMMALKGAPLGLSVDLTEIDDIADEALDVLAVSIDALTAVIEGLELDVVAVEAGFRKGLSTATDLADYVVKEHGIPFRLAHRIVGSAVADTMRQYSSLDMSDRATQEYLVERFLAQAARVLESVPSFDFENLRATLDVENSINARTTVGAANPREVLRMIEARERAN